MRKETVFQGSKAALAAAASSLAICGAAPAALAQTSGQEIAVQQIDIPAGPLGQSILAISDTFDVDILAPNALVSGKTAPAISGAVSVNEALRRALQGSMLEAIPAEDGAFVIAQQTAAASSAVADETAQASMMTDVIVVTGTQGSFPLGVGRDATLGVLGERALVDTPLSVKRFEEEFLRDAQSVRISDFATRDASFATLSAPADSVLSDGLLRGFRINFSEYTWNGFFPIISRNPPLEIVESIDIIKGPNALLTGARPFSPTSGTINIKTKAPIDEPLTRFTARFLGDGVFGGDADISRRMGAEDRFGVRANIAYREGEPLKENQQEEALTAHLALSYEGDRLRLNAEGLYSDYFLSGRNDGAVFYRPGVDVLDPIPDYERLAAPDWTFVDLETRNVQLRGEYDLTDTIEVFAALNVGSFFLSPKASQIFVTDADGTADVSGFFFASETDQTAFDVGLRWRFESGFFDNTLTLTGSMFDYDSGFVNFQRGIDLTGGQTVNVYDFESLISVPDFDSGFDRGDAIPKSDSREAVSVGFINETSFFEGKLDIIWGGRFTDFQQERIPTGQTLFDADDFSPSVGVIYKPLDNASLYFSYMEALEFGSQTPPGAANADTFTAPGRSESFEIGGKIDFGSFGATIAAFQITRPSAFLDPDTQIFDLFGEDRHRGVEADIFGEIVEGVRIYTSLAYLDVEIIENVNPLVEGNSPINVPEFSAAAGFDVDLRVIENAAVTGAMRYTGDRFFDTTNERAIDGAAIFDLGFRYGFILGETDLVARVKITNLFNKSYFAGASQITAPGESRNVLVSLTADF